MLKATSINKYGAESTPVSVWPNEHGYVELPYDPDAVQYALYAPFFNEAETGPWYLVRTISRREARAARQTIVGAYKQANLLPQLCPLDPVIFTLPEPLEGQTGWLIGDGLSPSTMWVEIHHRPQIGV